MQPSVRQAKLARLDVLELQAAQQGISTPPHITTEIRQLREELDLPVVVSSPPLERGVEEIKVHLQNVLREVQIAVNTGTKNMERLSRLEKQAEEDREERHERQQHQDEVWAEFRNALTNNREWIVIVAAVGAACIVVLAILLWHVGTVR